MSAKSEPSHQANQRPELIAEAIDRATEQLAILNQAVSMLAMALMVPDEPGPDDAQPQASPTTEYID